MIRRVVQLGASVALLSAAAAGDCAAQVSRTWTDASNDAVARRTDIGAIGEIIPGANLPDILSLTIGGWSPSNPIIDPYVGSFVPAAGAHIFRLDIVFKGLVNPPGLISASPSFHNPTMFGTSPLYAYIEFDADNDPNTGGELSLTSTYLGQAARFGARPQTSGERAITGACESEADCLTAPFYRRTGSEFALDLCGCFTPTLYSQDGNMNGVMDAGETFVVRGRFFARTSGYADASFAFGGFFPGNYDPIWNVRFKHTIVPDTTGLTTVSLVFPLTMHGYALLNGLQTDPLVNPNVADAVSVFEALHDVINYCNTQTLNGCVFDIANLWAGRNAADYLNVTTWRATALVGTTFGPPPTSGSHVWTDIGFDALYKDVDGDGQVTSADRNAVLNYLSLHDGDPCEDEDGLPNASIDIPLFGYYYNLYDLNYDGLVNLVDLSLFPTTCRVNWDGIGGVNSDDFFAFIRDFFNVEADYNGDGVTNTADFFAFLSEFFQGCP